MLEGVLVSLLVIWVSYMVVWEYEGDEEKGSVYECGYMPYREVRVPYTVRFVIVAILFMLFDVEVGYLYPWGLVQGGVGTREY